VQRQMLKFGAYDEADLDSYAPIVVHVGERNEVARVDSHPEILLDHEGSNR